MDYFRFARHPSTNLTGPSTRRAPAVSKFGGLVLSQCAAACV